VDFDVQITPESFNEKQKDIKKPEKIP